MLRHGELGAAVIWGRHAAFQRFVKIYEGTSKLEPDLAALGEPAGRSALHRDGRAYTLSLFPGPPLGEGQVHLVVSSRWSHIAAPRPPPDRCALPAHPPSPRQ